MLSAVRTLNSVAGSDLVHNFDTILFVEYESHLRSNELYLSCGENKA